MTKISLIFQVILLFLMISCSENITSNKNTTPTALFESVSDSGYTSTEFIFDATLSYDAEDSLSDLQIRWDWQNDGVWDTDYSKEKLISHIFKFKGVHTVKLEIIDSGGKTNFYTKDFYLENLFDAVTDIDGNIYKTVKIGNQWWLAENLKVTHYRNGDAIDYTTTDTSWVNITEGVYCVYNNQEVYKEDYGLLYNWYAINDSRRLAPEGWRVATDDDWTELEAFISNDPENLREQSRWGGDILREVGEEHWRSPNADATDGVGFSAVGSGYRLLAGPCAYLDWFAYFYTSSEFDSTYCYHRVLDYNSDTDFRGKDSKTYGMSVRCVKEE